MRYIIIYNVLLMKLFSLVACLPFRCASLARSLATLHAAAFYSIALKHIYLPIFYVRQGSFCNKNRRRNRRKNLANGRLILVVSLLSCCFECDLMEFFLLL